MANGCPERFPNVARSQTLLPHADHQLSSLNERKSAILNGSPENWGRHPKLRVIVQLDGNVVHAIKPREVWRIEDNRLRTLDIDLQQGHAFEAGHIHQRWDVEAAKRPGYLICGDALYLPRPLRPISIPVARQAE